MLLYYAFRHDLVDCRFGETGRDGLVVSAAIRQASVEAGALGVVAQIVLPYRDWEPLKISGCGPALARSSSAIDPRPLGEMRLRESMWQLRPRPMR